MYILDAINSIILYKILTIPLLIWVFIGVGSLLMFKIRFANIIRLPEALSYAIRGKNKDDSGKEGVGSITALMSQLACNLGIGNFAGSAFALYYGGPGVIIWFFILSFLSSAIKFGEVVLAHKYRSIEANGEIRGGTFYFIIHGIGKRYKCSKIIKAFAIVSALSVILISIGTGSMQFNQIGTLLFATNGVLYAEFNSIICTLIVGIVITILLFGGLKKVGAVSDVLVPIMGILYIGSCIISLTVHHDNILPTCKIIFESAFNIKTTSISFITMLLVSINRIISTTDTAAGFSAISQSNSNLKLAGQQGLVSFFDPFIVATIMGIGAFAILVVGVPYMETQYLGLLAIKEVFVSVHPGFEYMLIFIAFLFGFTTIMAVGFYVQQSCIFLFGNKFSKIYVLGYVLVYSVGAFNNITTLYKIMDIAYSIGVMVNLIAICLLVNDVKLAWQEYVLSKKNKT